MRPPSREGTHCPRCPDCGEHAWIATAEAALFAHELGRSGAGPFTDEVYARGAQLCSEGLSPVMAALIILAQDA